MARHSLYCDDCGVEMKEAYCDGCIEERLGRPIVEADLRPPMELGFTHIPCNAFWLEEKHKSPDLLKS